MGMSGLSGLSGLSALFRRSYTNKVKALSPIAYWPQAESSGTIALDESGNGRDGAYTNVTLGAAGIGDGRTAATFNGTTSINNVYSASLAGAFSGAAGSIACWIKLPDAAAWTNASVRRYINIQVSAAHSLSIGKFGASRLDWQYIANSVTLNRSKAALSSLAWLHMALTWSAANDRVIAYYNGAQEGATLTGLGVWAGALSAAGVCVGASSTVPTQIAQADIAHAAVWATELSAAQVASLATL